MTKYFAKLDLNSKVTKVHLVHQDTAPTEQAGINFLNTLFKTNDVWKETFKDQSQRKNYAAPDYTYDEDRDAFIPVKPFPSWILDENTCNWEAPVAYPNDGTGNIGKDGKNYWWNEATTSWDESS